MGKAKIGKQYDQTRKSPTSALKIMVKAKIKHNWPGNLKQKFVFILGLRGQKCGNHLQRHAIDCIILAQDFEADFQKKVSLKMLN